MQDFHENLDRKFLISIYLMKVGRSALYQLFAPKKNQQQEEILLVFDRKTTHEETKKWIIIVYE